MMLAPGTKFGSYEIVAPLGAGGMGEVYRARDAKLGRDIFLRRMAGPSRITIYQGGHETIAAPTFEWFEKHVKP